MSIPVQPDWPQPSHPHLIEVRHNPSTSPSPSTPGSATETEFNTSAHSLVTLPPGALFTPLTSPPLTLTRTKAYSSIQLSKNEHAELHSDLLYVNHSCEPSLVFDMAAREVRVAARRGRGVRVASRTGRVASGPGRVEGRVEEQEEEERLGVVEPQEEHEEQEQQEEQQEERGLEPGDELTFFYPSSEWSMAQPCDSPVCKGWIGGAKEMGRERMKGMWLNAFIEELLDEQEREAAAGAAAAKGVEATAVKDEEATTAAKDVEGTTMAVKDVEPTAAKDGDEQQTVKEERSKRTERKGSCNVQ